MPVTLKAGAATLASAFAPGPAGLGRVFFAR
jgi:hypothetical protein